MAWTLRHRCSYSSFNALTHRTQVWRDAVEVVAMDEFTAFKTATREDLPDEGR